MLSKFILFITILSFTFLRVSAQDDESNIMFNGTKNFVGGILVGMNASQTDGDNYSGFHKAGLNVGGIVYANFKDKCGLSLELLYSQKGAVGVHSSNNGQVGSFFEKYKMKLNYVEAPVIFHFYHVPWPKFNVNIGASYSALISSTETFDTYYPYNIDPSLYPFKKFEIDGIAGLSYVWGHLMFDVRYQYGITPLRNAYFAPEIARNGRDQRNNMVAIRLGYLF